MRKNNSVATYLPPCPRCVYGIKAIVLMACFQFSGCDSSTDSNPQIPRGNISPLTSVSCESGKSIISNAVQSPVLEKTLVGSWDENWFASPALIDISGDGLLDIIAPRHSVLYAYQHDGSPLWQTAWGHSASTSPEHGSSRMWASAAAGDFDGDGNVEIAVGSDADSSLNKNVAVYDHRGKLLQGWPLNFGNTEEIRAITAGDTNNDGAMEIIVNKTASGPVTAVYTLNGNMAAGWPQTGADCDPPAPAEACWDYGGYNQNIAMGDVDGDGLMDVVSSYDAIGFGIFHGNGAPFETNISFNDRVVTATEAYHDLTLAQQGWGNGDRSEYTYSPPVIADINGDGHMNIILAGDHESSQSTQLQGVSLWVLNSDMTRPQGWQRPVDLGTPLSNKALGNNMVSTKPNPSVADFLNNPGLEIIVPAYDGYLHAFYANGEKAWQYRFSQGGDTYTGASEALIADINDDGNAEIIFTTWVSGAAHTPDLPAHLIVLDRTGKALHRIKLSGRGAMAAPSIADLDQDGELELVISLKDSLGSGKGGVQIWNLPGSSDNCLLWPTGRGNVLRQGYVPPSN